MRQIGELPPRSLPRVPAARPASGYSSSNTLPLLYRCVGRLSQNAPHMPVSLSETGRLAETSALSSLPGQTSHPRRHLVRGRKRFRRGPLRQSSAVPNPLPVPAPAPVSRRIVMLRNASAALFSKLHRFAVSATPAAPETASEIALQTALTVVAALNASRNCSCVCPESRCSASAAIFAAIRLPLSHCLQHPSGAQTQQIAHMTRKLDPRLFQKPFHLVLQPPPGHGPAAVWSCHGAPQPLLRSGTKLRISSPAMCRLTSRSASLKSRLRPLAPVGMRLRQMQSVFAFQWPARPVSSTARSIPLPLPSRPVLPASGSVNADLRRLVPNLRFSTGTRPLSLRL